ncbi:MAG: hypothetical protein D6728_02745 [Cyanobacteria bacterium J055]|nr:MAG: hypothetical protein D6728_02745 [Cyanobacteria bacterium J055]
MCELSDGEVFKSVGYGSIRNRTCYPIAALGGNTGIILQKLDELQKYRLNLLDLRQFATSRVRGSVVSRDVESRGLPRPLQGNQIKCRFINLESETARSGIEASEARIPI